MADAALANGVEYSFHTWWMSYRILSSKAPYMSRELSRCPKLARANPFFTALNALCG